MQNSVSVFVLAVTVVRRNALPLYHARPNYSPK